MIVNVLPSKILRHLLQWRIVSYKRRASVKMLRQLMLMLSFACLVVAAGCGDVDFGAGGGGQRRVPAELHESDLDAGQQDAAPNHEVVDDNDGHDRRRYLEDERRDEARDRLERRNEVERGERFSHSPPSDDGPDYGRTYLEDERRSEAQRRQDALNEAYRREQQGN